MEPDRFDRASHQKIDTALRGSGADVNATQCTAKDSGTDTGTESNFAGMGRVLQTRPHPKALSPTRRLDSAAHLVASFPPVADSGLEAVVPGQAVRRVWSGQPDLASTFS